MTPFPLPHEATAQNLALYILAWQCGGEVQETDPIKMDALSS